MWLSCHGTKAICDEVGLDERTVQEFLQKSADLEELPKPRTSAISHDSDFKAQIYSVWNFAKA
jgi:hypothetical protein